jgi:hypothetical protein
MKITTSDDPADDPAVLALIAATLLGSDLIVQGGEDWEDWDDQQITLALKKAKRIVELAKDV